MQKDIKKLRQRFRNGRSELFRRKSWTFSSRGLLKDHTILIDSLIKEIYELSARDADSKAERDERSGLCIVATGGYGRQELNPYSDVDIAFIPSEQEDPWVEAAVHTAFRLVMDVFLSLKDIQVGYSFRPISEASSWDVTVKTALLDLRPICGDFSLADRLKQRISEVLSPLDLTLETSSSLDPCWSRGGSIYAVEPSLKEGPGTLRDLHRARWIFKLLLGADDDELAPAIVQNSGISGQQIEEVKKAADWFWRARTWLHLASGRHADVLITNYQDRIARELGNCSAQDWLSEHLKHSEVLAAFHKAAVQTMLQGPLDIDGLRLENGDLHLPDSLNDNDSTVRAFHLSQRHAIPIGLNDLKRLWKNRDQAEKVAEPSKREVQTFKGILNGQRDIAATLRMMAQFGFLDRFIPGFSEVMRSVPPDPAHSHTVGEHSLRMVEHLENLRAGLDRQGCRFKDLLDQCTHFDMLCLAALLHDAGKLQPGDDHCETSAELAKSVAKTLNLSTDKRNLLDILIRQHLLLVRTTRLHDLTSVNTIQRVAASVPNMEALRHLYLFTYIDTFAVSDKNWTSMDERDLEDLYRKMQDFYASTSDDASDSLAPEARIGLIRKRLVALHPSEKEMAVLKHCETMPAGYLLNTSLDDIANHLKLFERLETERVVFDVYNRPGDDYTELTICTPDETRPGLLSKISGVLYGCAIDILKAQAYTMEKKNSVVVDTLWIRSNGMQISEHKARKIQIALKDVLTGARTMEQFLEQSGKEPPGGVILEGIDLRNDLSEEHTVVHIIANDLPGLLYVMSSSLSRCGLHIHSAKITTWQAHAENNFYVTTDTGGQIPEADLPLWTERLKNLLQDTHGRD